MNKRESNSIKESRKKNSESKMCSNSHFDEYCNINLSDNHVKVIKKALETYYRLKSFQVKMALEIAYGYGIDYEKGLKIEEAVKDLLPNKLDRNSFYGCSSPEIGDARTSFEIEKILDEYISVKENNGFWGSTTNFYGPIKCSKEPYPVINNFKNYKDYPVPAKLTDQITMLQKLKNYLKVWELIDAQMKFPRCERAEILFNENENSYFVRCYKPRDSKY